MWIIDWLPAFVVPLLILVSVLGILASFVLEFIPFVSTYKTVLQVICIVVLAFGLYLEGGIAEKSKWEAKVLLLQVELANKQVVSADATVQVITKYIDKVKIVKEKGDVIVEKVPVYITEKSDANCIIPKSFVVLHDSASKNEVPKTTGAIDESASGVKLSTVTETVVQNYTTYHELAEQLKALQDWVTKQEKIYNDN